MKHPSTPSKWANTMIFSMRKACNKNISLWQNIWNQVLFHKLSIDVEHGQK